MKKWMSIILAAVLCVALFACSAAEGEKTAAQTHRFDLAKDEVLMVENTVFTEDVIISGDNAQILFVGCEFEGNVINEAKEFTRVMLLDGCTVAGSLVLDNGLKEATIETPMPKFLIINPIPVIMKDCMGVVIALGDFELQVNGETFTMADSQLFFDNTKPENGMVPYEGQEATCYIVGQWWENGEKVMFIECEYEAAE